MNIPFYVTASVVVVAAIAAMAIPITLARASRRAALPVNVAAFVGLALGAGFVLTTALAAAGVYELALGEVVPAVSLGLLAVLAGAGLAILFSPRLRRVLDHPAAQQGVIALQSWRIEGAAFLVLMVLGQLPPLFALPAGLGDLFVGLTAPFVARMLLRPGARRWAIAWNLFGLADLAVAVGLGVTTTPPTQLFFTTPTSVAITAFPLAIIPTFLVPLSIMLHLVSLRYLFSAAARAGPSEKTPWTNNQPVIVERHLTKAALCLITEIEYHGHPHRPRAVHRRRINTWLRFSLEGDDLHCRFPARHRH
ncbi:MAG TPA: hypothetical protein VI793_00925 [Anaerolineales bacterium]|nr:hypothetical protein [Anaerolineales bacterium]